MPMVGRLLSQGLACLPVLMAMSLRMIKQLGFIGTLDFSKAAINVGAPGKLAVENFVKKFNQQNHSAIQQLFVDGDERVFSPACDSLGSVKDLLAQNSQLSVGKMLAAGNCISASVTIKGIDKQYAGVAIFEFNRRSKLIDRTNFYMKEEV